MDRNARILYVDDEKENLLVFQSTFRRYFEILTANSASEAGRLLLDHEVDVIISDQRMPDMSGVDFLKSLPDGQKNIRIIMTGYSDIEAVIEALNSGKIYKYIPKPWEKDNLLDVLTHAVNHLESDTMLSETSHPGLKENHEENKSGESIGQLKYQLQEAYKNIHLLAEIGQDITSSLNLDVILNKVYKNVNRLMDASIFGIGIVNREQHTIDYKLAIENGLRYQPYSRTMDDKSQFPVWCIDNKKEVFINDIHIEHSRYIPEFKDNQLNIEPTLEDGSTYTDPVALIYMPVFVKDQVMGLISVQSFQKNAYSEFHLNTLRNIAIYVSTALENAKTYEQIQKHREEIESKNEELEIKVKQRTEQLEQKNEEVQQQRDELESTHNKLKRLSDIGRKITSSLSLDKIIENTYENVNSLMDASVFGIGVYNPDNQSLEFSGLIEKGVKQPFAVQSLENEDRLAVWCFRNRKEVFINDYLTEYNKYTKNVSQPASGGIPQSLIYLPLIAGEDTIGVITVQSFRTYTYNQYHLDILRSLASFITIAIQNSNSYKKMMDAFDQLKSTQSKLVESEKMASLGVLTAGVAHEINNPVNFISGGIQSLEENYDDLSLLLENYNRYFSQPDEKHLHQIKELEKKIQVDKLIPEIKELISSIKNGARRTSEIVKGLRNFSRLDENDMKKVSLEEGIDSTLIILNNQLKGKVEVIKQYGNIPELMCFPGQLNQVFMNIIYNAADAIQEKGEIIIKTWKENNHVKISIKDNGTGMPESVRDHIFEPFFTTKPVGKGTGLGLSISFGIIEKHEGKIEVESEPGKGTTFTIILPIK